MTVERESFDLVRTRAGDASVFTLGIGSSVNRFIIDGLARAGNGEAFVATGEADGAVAMRRLQAYIDAPLLTRLQISFSGAFQAEQMSPPALPDVFASRPVTTPELSRSLLRSSRELERDCLICLVCVRPGDCCREVVGRTDRLRHAQRVRR